MPALPSRAPRTALPPSGPQISDPLELLLACHDKVRHFTGLLQRLEAHVRSTGADTQAQDAARAVLRYFEMAAPKHHADEDQDLFPALMRLNDSALNDTMAQLSLQHDQLGVIWLQVASWLQALTQGNSASLPIPIDAIQAFCTGYQAHARLEEAQVFPHAQRLPPDALAQVAAAMVARRTA